MVFFPFNVLPTEMYLLIVQMYEQSIMYMYWTNDHLSQGHRAYLISTKHGKVTTLHQEKRVRILQNE